MAEKSLEAHFIKCLKEGNTKKALYIVELLGDKVNTLYRGKSPLLWAKEFENKEVARVLKEKGAVEKAISKEEAEKLGIELVEEARKRNLEAVIELIEKGAKVNQENDYGETALIKASQNGHLEIVEKLIDAGANLNVKDENKKTALMWALDNEYIDIALKLIEKGADVNQKDDVNNISLITASFNGYLEIVERLIEKGAKVNQKNEWGNTALIWASRKGYVEIVKALLDAGADVNIKSNTGSTAMSLAKNEETRRAILDAVKKRKEKAKENEPGFMEKMKGLFGKGE